MGLPNQVQRQVEAVELFDKKVAETQTPKPEDEPGTEAPADGEHKPEVAAPEPPAKQDEDAALWKQRFLSLQGMYNSQVPVLQQQLKQRQDQIEDMQQAKKPEATQAGDSPLVTKTDVEAFGEDLIDMSRRVAQEEIQRQARVYEERIAKLSSELQAARQDVGNVAQTQAQSQQEQFLQALNARLPNWKQLQETAECQQFLGTHIPGTRTEWNDALLNAANRYDLTAVAEIFDQFFRAHPQLAPKPKQAQQRAQPNRSELERQVAPSKSGASAPSPQSGKVVYTGAQYEAESMRMVRMAQVGKHDEAARLEAELNAALAEGRVRG